MKIKSILFFKYFFFVLFIGYYASITLFTHTHIQNGVTIVHSHPFSNGTEKNPVKHQHTANGFLLIQVLSILITLVSFLSFSMGVLIAVLKKYILQKNEENLSICFYISSNGLRAPPLNIYN
ncbi:MAG: hypothetical protein KKG99_04595 [Bacteroidetes bacterium]|nr:hypothetical protein [Bacteroidota bacterium]